jgi:hypothetical protein
LKRKAFDSALVELRQSLRPRDSTVEDFVLPGLRIALRFEPDDITAAARDLGDHTKWMPKPAEWEDALVQAERDRRRRMSKLSGRLEVPVSWQQEFAAFTQWICGFVFMGQDWPWLQAGAMRIDDSEIEKRLSRADPRALGELAAVVEVARSEAAWGKIGAAARDIRRALTYDQVIGYSNQRPSDRVAMVEAAAARCGS